MDTTTPPGQAGFTLLELMIVLAIAAVLVGIAAPNFNLFILNNRMATETNKLMGDISLARSEAIKRSANVVICVTTAPGVIGATCDGNGGAWQTGWLVYADLDNAAGIDEAAGDVLIKAGTPSSDAITISSNSGSGAITEIVYQPNGTLLTTSASALRLALCDERGATAGRQINISLTGRPELVKGTRDAPLNSCTSPTFPAN